MDLTKNRYVSAWVKEVAELTGACKIEWINGSKEQLDLLKRRAFETGELVELDQSRLPGCMYHRSNENDVARVEERTFICTSGSSEDVGPTNNWMQAEQAYKLVKEIARGKMKGRTMYVIPYCMGPLNSPFSKIGYELTDSIYVVLNMAIMTRAGSQAEEMLGWSDAFVKGVHCSCDIDPEKRYIMHFPEDNAIWSVNSAYGGNALLGKKCFALRIASFQGLKEGWLAEHMLILGVENPGGEIKYMAAAFPSACGKTNLAMLIPPQIYKEKGYKVWTVGDDIAWIRIGKDGRLWAINPEAGFFGVAPGTNMKSNPNAMLCTQTDTIFTNVVLNPDKTVWWEHMDRTKIPIDSYNWKGELITAESKPPFAHPNSRFTSPSTNCPCISGEWENPEGVPLSAIIFGGRRSRTAPLVYQTRDWNHGVFAGSIMSSETTAAADGTLGVVRRDPMAMLPFCGYNMADYWQHWIDMGKMVTNKPKIFNVNWFRTDEDGNFIWPGFGENFRVIEWILKRCNGKADAVNTEIGYIPKPSDISLEELDYEIAPGKRFGVSDLKEILAVDREYWLEDVQSIKKFYAKFDKVPDELTAELNKLESSLMAGIN